MLKKSLIKNESGNILAVIVIIGMIAGLIGYWTSLSDKSDKELRTLSATQSTTFLRSDFENTIRQSLRGINANCSSTTASGLYNSFKENFRNYSKTSQEAQINKTYTNNPATTINEITANTSALAEIKCFFNITRYNSLDWQKIQVSIRRISEPNYINLSTFISADIIVSYKSSGKPFSLKYQLKYRMDVLTMNSFGLLFTNTSNTLSPLFELSDPDSKVKVRSTVLFDSTTQRNKPTYLRNYMRLPDSDRLIFTSDVYSSASSFLADPTTLTFLQSKNIFDVFKRGIEFNYFKDPTSTTLYKAPYEINPNEWSEFIDYKPMAKVIFSNATGDGYPLPSLSSSQTAVIYDTISNTLIDSYSGTPVIHSDTSKIYPHIFPTSSGVTGATAKDLIKSCTSVEQLETMVYPLFVFNNINADFTIDFTQNKDIDHPPVFCGLIAAHNLTIKLNGEPATSDFLQHHIIGKFIISGKIKILNKGFLNIHDIMNFTDDLITYPGLGLNISNVRTQFYNYKYYSFQNFFLPFFKAGTTPSVSSPADLISSTNNNRFYVPRATKTFFQQSCGTGNIKCRVDNIDSPLKEHLMNTHWLNLLFEVYIVE